VLIVSLVLGLNGCNKFTNLSSWEAELSPLAMALSYTQETDLMAASVVIPRPTGEIELNAEQQILVLMRIRTRTPINDTLISLSELKHYKVILRRAENAAIEQARIEHGQPHPYVVTVYLLDKDGTYDRKTSPFFTY
jgi:hypothetical protein